MQSNAYACVYEGKEVVGSDLVDDVRLVKFEDGKSTTSIIKRIENAKDDM